MFLPGLFVVLQEIFYQPFFCSNLTDYCKKKCIFKIKQFFFNLLLAAFDFAVLCICVSNGTFSQFCHHETVNSFMFAYIHSFLFGPSSKRVI